ncbi:MAG: hypothetical protein ACJ735_17685 [Actinomycetes bacterium]
MRFRAFLAAVLVLAFGSACSSRHHTAAPVTKTLVFGQQTSYPLRLDPPGQVGSTRVSELTARRLMRPPFTGPANASGVRAQFLGPNLKGPLQVFGLAHVITSNADALGAPRQPEYQGQLAWVGVYELSGNQTVSRPDTPTTSPVPPPSKHYYFAVFVDPNTGQLATWEET